MPDSANAQELKNHRKHKNHRATEPQKAQEPQSDRTTKSTRITELQMNKNHRKCLSHRTAEAQEPKDHRSTGTRDLQKHKNQRTTEAPVEKQQKQKHNRSTGTNKYKKNEKMKKFTQNISSKELAPSPTDYIRRVQTGLLSGKARHKAEEPKKHSEERTNSSRHNQYPTVSYLSLGSSALQAHTTDATMQSHAVIANIIILYRRVTW